MIGKIIIKIGKIMLDRISYGEKKEDWPICGGVVKSHLFLLTKRTSLYMLNGCITQI
ncbi:MAG: hypothetical protein BAJALOKI3v1_170041 [Promethearchaeota archaeon]|nr:MAG: hypothetical protein BAJALOKI3v1_170041 [Candidatus Lokiarchaeota archaeon]